MKNVVFFVKLFKDKLQKKKPTQCISYFYYLYFILLLIKFKISI